MPGGRALTEAWEALAPAIREPSLPEFLELIERSLQKWACDSRGDLEQLEKRAAAEYRKALELRWEDERSLSNAERRLDSQFTRALADFQAARAASARLHEQGKAMAR